MGGRVVSPLALVPAALACATMVAVACNGHARPPLARSGGDKDGGALPMAALPKRS